MSSPISAGDILLLVGFATKVVNALKDGGSRAQYQMAEHQCRGFLRVMEEIQALDLTHLPESFRASLDEYSADLTGFVKEFKEGIDKYDTSLGKSSARGWLASAPRKVQWAFAAADDLDKFRLVLDGHLDLVKVTIQGGLLAMVSRRGDSGLALPLLLKESSSPMRAIEAPPAQRLLEWPRASPGYELRWSSPVDQIADLVYERLLSRPPATIQFHKRIHTLPKDGTLFASAATEGDSSTPRKNADEDINSGITGSLDQQEDGPSGPDSTAPLSDDINEILHDLNLAELSSIEASRLDNLQSSQRLLLTDGIANSNPNIQTNGQQPGPERTDPKRKRSKSKFMTPWSAPDPVSAAQMAIWTFQAASQLAIALARFSREVRGAQEEWSRLAKETMQYSQLLQVVADTMKSPFISAELRSLGERDVLGSLRVLEHIRHVLEHKVEHKQGVRRVLMAVRWTSSRSGVLEMLDQIKTLKSSLSLLLQLHQVQLTTAQTTAQTLALNATTADSREIVRRAS